MRRFTLLFSLLLLAAGTTALAQSQSTEGRKKTGAGIIKHEVPIKTSFGRMGIGVAEPTSEGEWKGTWIYISRDYRIALWMAEDRGKPIAKLKFESTLRATESFETDWAGKVRYFVQDHPGTFELRLDEVGPDHIDATWDWQLAMRGSSRIEKGDLELYRAGDGRNLVMFFKNFERTIVSGGQERKHAFPQSWTFRKMSRRLVLWEELPL